jgi:acetolactate synthase-1/2/3 large subunit
MASGGEPGPVMIELDLGALSREQPLARKPRPVRPDGPDESVATMRSRLRALFARAERPVLLLGQGAFGAATRLAALADSLTIPVVTTPTARGILSEAHPMAMGFDSLRGHTTTVNALFERSDLILALGCKLGHNGSAGFDLRLPADRFVHVDAEPGVAGATYDATLAITARVQDVMPALESRRTVSGWGRDELEVVGRALRAPTGREVEPVVRGANAMTPAAFFAWLRDELPADAIVVTDSGLHQILTRRYFEVRSTRGLIVPTDFQAMGYGLPAAIGAKLAAPDRPVVAVVGDGGFLMSGMELLTARREGAALVVVVFNDGQLNQIRLQQWAAFGHAHAVQLLNPDYRALAAAFDVAYLRFGEHGPGEFARALGESKPVLVEVIVGDSLAMRALPPVILAKELARATLGSAVRRWLKARLRRATV